MRKLFVLLFLTAIAILPRPLAAQQDPVLQSWNKPVVPFRIIGNLYYVGANELTSYLIVTPRGLIVLDGGAAETAPMILRNIETLGFHTRDVKILLNSHAHLDHAGGLAALKRATGAKFLAMAGDAPVLERGGKGDPQFGDTLPFPAIKPDELLHDLSLVSLGGTTLTAHLTPGHTKGCTTWTMTVTEGRRSYHVVFVGSPSVPGQYKLVGNPTDPDAIAEFRHQFVVLKSLPCDIFLASHGNFYDLSGKSARLAKGAHPNPFIDPKGYRAYVDRMEKAFEKKAAAAARR